MYMRAVTKLMIEEYGIKKIKMDFMGFPVEENSILSFHHLIVPRAKCKELGLGEGYEQWNGAILRQDPSHDYLHIIQKVDKDIYSAISREMIIQNLKGYIDSLNLRRIDDCLRSFEREHCADCTEDGSRLLIKERYTIRAKL